MLLLHISIFYCDDRFWFACQVEGYNRMLWRHLRKKKKKKYWKRKTTVIRMNSVYTQVLRLIFVGESRVRWDVLYISISFKGKYSILVWFGFVMARINNFIYYWFIFLCLIGVTLTMFGQHGFYFHYLDLHLKIKITLKPLRRLSERCHFQAWLREDSPHVQCTFISISRIKII